ncbi:PrsW family intramembrane metalloprotease [Luedemannella flava]
MVNTTAGWLFERWGISDIVVGVVVAPVIEETMKAAFPIGIFLLARRRFSGVTDGIVFCGLSATGFAMVENILYLGGYGYAPGAEQSGFAGGALAVEAMFIGRVLLSGFGHPLFTSMTGIGLGIAARSADRRVRVLAPLLGLLLAMSLHATWNLMATLGQDVSLYFTLYGYFSVFVPIFLTVTGVVIWVRSWEGRLTERVLPAYAAAGWFSPPEVTALGTLGRRLSARAWARRVSGDAGATAMRGYQFAATRLALLRDGLDRGLDNRPHQVAEAVAEERALLAAIEAYRQVFTRRDPMTPPARWDGHRYHVVFPDGVPRPVEAPPLPVVPVPFLAQR